MMQWRTLVEMNDGRDLTLVDNVCNDRDEYGQRWICINLPVHVWLGMMPCILRGGWRAAGIKAGKREA